jgi:hypothetical protein
MGSIFAGDTPASTENRQYRTVRAGRRTGAQVRSQKSTVTGCKLGKVCRTESQGLPRRKTGPRSQGGQAVEYRWPSVSRGRGPVSLFDRVGFAHVFALFSLAVKTRAFLVIKTCLGVDPHEAVSAAWRRGGADVRLGFGFRGTDGRGSRSGRRRADRTLRFEEVSERLLRRRWRRGHRRRNGSRRLSFVSMFCGRRR